MISHRHRCIYIKTPKCASTSVRDWFVAHAGGLHSFYPAWYPGPLPYRIQLLARALELYPGYFTFTLLRNPYRRFVSLHLSRNPPRRAKRSPDSRVPVAFRKPARIRPALRRAPRRRERTLGPGGAGVLRRQRGPPLWAARDPVPAISACIATHSLPQVDFLPDCNPERLFGVARARPRPLSFIGAVETLDTDFPFVQDALGLPPLPLPHHNTSASAPAAFENLRRNAATRRLDRRDLRR